MSHNKRSWGVLGYWMTGSEDFRAQRSAKFPFKGPLSPCEGIDDDNDNDDSSQNTTNTTSASVTTASSITPNTLSASPSSPINTSRGSARLGVPSEYTGEGGLDERIVYFGMLLDGRMKPFRQSELPLYPFHKSASEDRIALQLRFRHDCISVLLDAHGEIAVLDKKMAAVLRLLKETVTGTILKVFLGNGRGRDDRDSAGKRSTLGLPLEIEVHGLDKDYSKIGSTLSNASMYLQEPVILDQGVTYRNPHFLSWDENGVTPQLNTSGRDIETDFETAIEAILESPNPVLVAPDLEQDARISTQLRSHQLSALKFMLIREEERQHVLTLWKPHRVNNRTGFKHVITGETRSVKPPESRGGILSDEMGMGKSLALIALIVHTLDVARSSERHHEGCSSETEPNKTSHAPTLIIAPKSILYGWELEIKKHTAIALHVHTFYGQGASIDYENLVNYDVVITSYQTVFSDSIRSKTLLNVFWFRVVLDEAHQIRNRTNAFQAILNLKTDRRWCLTGTPVQNRLEDLFTLTEFLQFHPVENRRNARRWILDPLGRREDYAVENLRLLMRTVSSRRSRGSERKHLRSEIEVAVELSRPEREQYERIRANAGRMKASMGKTVSASTLLSYILRMRQICSHGLQEQASASKSADARARVSSDIFCNKCFEPLPFTSMLKSSGVKSGEAVFCLECTGEESGNLSLASDPLANQDSYRLERVVTPPETDTSLTKMSDDSMDVVLSANNGKGQKPSSKIQSVIRNLMQLGKKHNEDLTPTKSLVFSLWTTTLDALEHALSACNMACARIDGSLGLEQRRKALARFQSEPDVRIMLLSFGTGSVGLNLTVATHVHLVEPQWNPMVEAQAAARVDRLDQDKDVVILRYVVKESIEKNITARQRHKLWLAKISTPADTAASPLEIDNSRDLCSLIE